MRVYNTVGSDSLLSRQLSVFCLVRFGPGEKALRRFIALKKLLLELIHIASVFCCFFLVMLGYSMRLSADMRSALHGGPLIADEHVQSIWYQTPAICSKPLYTLALYPKAFF